MISTMGSSILRTSVGRGGNFGGTGDSSMVETSAGELLIASAGGMGGGDADGNGGDGYCGGGGGGAGYTPGDGGYDGGDGEQSPFNGGEGGHGSGVNVTTLVMEHFTLSPGQGGVGVLFYGGGGGGVLVTDPQGNQHGNHQTEPDDGVGYGAGGTTATSGAVLVEIVA